MRNATDESTVLVDGPWTHRTVSAAGTRFHVAELGKGPLVLLLHGFPQFWWTWRHQLTALADAGYRAVAMDLRGYGASDKPPRGYDLITLSSDAAGLIRALGEADAAVIGHGSGGLVAWTMGVHFPRSVRSLAVVSMPHPLRLRAAMLDSRQSRASRDVFALLPVLPERRLIRSDADLVAAMLRERSRPGWPDHLTERRCRDAIQIPGVARRAVEHHRWLLRSQLPPGSARFRYRMREPIRVPTLQIHGVLDPYLLPASVYGSGRYVDAPYRLRLVEDAGHYPHQEQPASVNAMLLSWLSDT